MCPVSVLYIPTVCTGPPNHFEYCYSGVNNIKLNEVLYNTIHNSTIQYSTAQCSAIVTVIVTVIECLLVVLTILLVVVLSLGYFQIVIHHVDLVDSLDTSEMDDKVRIHILQSKDTDTHTDTH